VLVVSVGGGGGGGGSSSFFFFASEDVVVVLVDAVSVVSAGVAVVVIVVSVCSRDGRSLGIAGVVLPTVSVTTGAVVRGRDGADARGYEDEVVDTGGSDPAIEVPVVSVPSGAGFVGKVKFVVVSTFVSVSTGAFVSPGALIVDVTPLAEPS
jgi:hypothetical protein